MSFERISLVALSLAASLFVQGCGMLGADSADPQNMRADTDEVAASTLCEYPWMLHSLTVDGREHDTGLFWRKLWRDRPYLTCDDRGIVRGSAGANPFTGRFLLSDDGALRWPKSPRVSSMGGPRDSSELEKDFLRALPQTDQLKIRGDTLILTGDAGAIQIEFHRAEEMPK